MGKLSYNNKLRMQTLREYGICRYMSRKKI